MTPKGWKTEPIRLSVLATGVVLFAAVAFACAYVIEHWLEYALALGFIFLEVTLTPIIEESLKILPFSLAAYLLHRYLRVELTKGERIGGLWSIGLVFGFLEESLVYHAGGIYLLPKMLVHGSMTGVAGFFKCGILASILLHVITNSIPNELFEVWRCLLVGSFLAAVLIAVVKHVRGCTAG